MICNSKLKEVANYLVKLSMATNDKVISKLAIALLQHTMVLNAIPVLHILIDHSMVKLLTFKLN